MESDELDDVSQAYEVLIEALDRLDLSVEEIRAVAEAFNGVSEGDPFSVSVLGHGLPTYEQTIMIKH